MRVLLPRGKKKKFNVRPRARMSIFNLFVCMLVYNFENLSEPVTARYRFYVICMCFLFPLHMFNVCPIQHESLLLALRGAAGKGHTKCVRYLLGRFKFAPMVLIILILIIIHVIYIMCFDIFDFYNCLAHMHMTVKAFL